MRRWAFAAAMAVVCTTAGLAQVQLQPTSRPKVVPKEVPLQDKLRYLCKLLDLNPQQWQHAEGLFTLLDAEVNLSREEMVQRLLEIQRVVTAREAAKNSGDTRQFQELTDRLRELQVREPAQKHFIEGLTPVLTEQQKAKLPELLKQLEGAAELSLKPVQVLRAARALNLSPDQSRRLEQIEKDFRQAAAEAGDSEPTHGAALVDKLVREISAMLDSNQRSHFDREIERLRPPPPSSQPARPASSAPAVPTPGPQP